MSSGVVIKLTNTIKRKKLIFFSFNDGVSYVGVSKPKVSKQILYKLSLSKQTTFSAKVSFSNVKIALYGSVTVLETQKTHKNKQ